MHKDIFISYKDEITGSSFAARLCSDFEKVGYSVYYNPNEKCSGAFPDKIKTAIRFCKDFVLILSSECLKQLKEHHKIDWVREELLTAKDLRKNIIPILLPGVSMPKDKDEMPEDLRFLPDINGIAMPDSYDISPLQVLFSWLEAKPLISEDYNDVYNDNRNRSINDDYEKAKNSTDAKSQFELANQYYFGLVGDESGCERNYKNAYQILENLSVNDDEYGLYADSIIAEMYYHGIVPRKEQSYSVSLAYHEKAKQVSGFSKREAAYLKSRGCGCEFDYYSIIEYYTTAIEQGDSMAIIGLAKFYLKFGKFKEAAALFERSKKVLPEADFQLGMLYREGVLSDPPKPDFYKAAFYFQHAINSGYRNPELYHQFGRLYFTPIGDFEKDFNLAEKYFLIAADAGNASAQYKLGLMYEYGYIKKDVEKAIHYHSLSAAGGDAKSAYHLALLYQDPLFRNYREAFKNAEFAASKGIMEGEFIFAIFLFYGRGCEADEDKAYIFFKKAYEHGMQIAKIYLDKYSK